MIKTKFDFEVHKPILFMICGRTTNFTFKSYYRGYDAYMTIWKPTAGVNMEL